MGEAVRKAGVSDETYYRWRREYGDSRIDEEGAKSKNGAIRLFLDYYSSQRRSMFSAEVYIKTLSLMSS